MNTPVPAPDAVELGALVDHFDPMRKPVSVEVAQHVLWFFGDQSLGEQPGSFTTSLIRAISNADVSNRGRLRLGFPDHVAAVVAVTSQHEGLEWLQGIVRTGGSPAVGQLVTCEGSDVPHGRSLGCQRVVAVSA